MAALARKDIRTLEKYLQMGGGHLLDFSHRTLAEFFEDYGVDIDEQQYQVGSGSKANRMRGFWQEGSEITVGLVLKGLIDYYDEKRASSTYFDSTDYSDDLRTRCVHIANQLSRGTYSAQLGSQPNPSNVQRSGSIVQAPTRTTPTQGFSIQPVAVKQFQSQQAPVQHIPKGQPMQAPVQQPTQTPVRQTDLRQKVFIVHGHDDVLRLKVENFIQKLGLNPIVLMDQASAGNTIIEKIHEYGDVDYAIILYTPCDEARNIGTSELRGRARQNVVFEHGYFIGRLGRRKVAAMVEPSVEIQNDIKGVVYIGTETDWQTQLIREFKKAALKFDTNLFYT
jgi:predicted nucleotide-binding protein